MIRLWDARWRVRKDPPYGPTLGIRLGVSVPRCVVIAVTMILTVVGHESAVGADGGVLRSRQNAGPFIVSIFTAPEPLRVGPVEVSVFVQSIGGTVLTDAVVDLLFESTTRPIERRRARATPDAASNKLAKTAVVDLPAAGHWTLTISVRSNAETATVACLVPVAAARSRLSLIWPWLLTPPIVIALFAVHQTLKRQRSSARLVRART